MRVEDNINYLNIMDNLLVHNLGGNIQKVVEDKVKAVDESRHIWLKEGIKVLDSSIMWS